MSGTYLYLISSTGESLSRLADGGGESKETKSSTEQDADEVEDWVLKLHRRDVVGGGLINGTLGSPKNIN